MAESLMTTLINKGMGRGDAHELMRKISLKASSENKSLKTLLWRAKKIYDDYRTLSGYSFYLERIYTIFEKEKEPRLLEKALKLVHETLKTHPDDNQFLAHEARIIGLLDSHKNTDRFFKSLEYWYNN